MNGEAGIISRLSMQQETFTLFPLILLILSLITCISIRQSAIPRMVILSLRSDIATKYRRLIEMIVHSVWRWGGKHNQFTFLGDTLKFSHQHDPARITNGNITMWDNGNLHTKIVADTIATVPSSRAIEYKLDEVNHTATAVWQYNNLPYSSAAGNVQRFDNTGNTFDRFRNNCPSQRSRNR